MLLSAGEITPVGEAPPQTRNSGTYGAFTLAFDAAHPSSESLGAAGSYRPTIVDGFVTAIDEQA